MWASIWAHNAIERTNYISNSFAPNLYLPIILWPYCHVPHVTYKRNAHFNVF